MKTNRLESTLSDHSVRFQNQPAFAQRPNATHTTAADFRRSASTGLDQLGSLREQVAASLEQEFAGTIGPRFVRQIVNEATALAATTSFPTLLLPTLAEEKARKASAWAARQQAMLNPALTLAA
jgi:hypothetical protein